MTSENRKFANFGKYFALTALALALAGPAQAGGDIGYKDTPPPEPLPPARQLEFSANVALTTDYVFRGISQTDENPAIQGGFDLTYKPFYVGIWASNLDFGGAVTPSGELVDVADIEIDYYGGITHTLHGIDLDLGVIYYTYPNAYDPGAELDYWEIKFGWSATVLKDVGIGTTVYYSPEYTGEVGDNWVVEGTIEKPLFAGLTLDATLGNQWGDGGSGGIDYTYWNVGLSKEFQEKFKLDVRYWDTDIGGCSSAVVFQCDARVVATISASM